MDATLGYIIIAVSLIGGVLLLTGHGSFLLRGGNADERNQIYDQKKVERATGITLLIIGIATVADVLVYSLVEEIIYLIFVVVVFAGLIVYMRTKCRK